MIDLIEIRRLVQAMNEIKAWRFCLLCLILMASVIAYAVHGGDFVGVLHIVLKR